LSLTSLLSVFHASRWGVRVHSFLHRLVTLLVTASTIAAIIFAFRLRTESVARCIKDVRDGGGGGRGVGLPRDTAPSVVQPVCEGVTATALVAMCVGMVIVLLLMISHSTVVAEYYTKLKSQDTIKRLKRLKLTPRV
jgi:hypothetical protein